MNDATHSAMRFGRLTVNGGPDGEQPFTDPTGRWLIAVNGEIYNHAELRRRHRLPASDADCRVLADLVPLLGDATFAQLRGMFAAVILDSRERTLRLVRDPFGTKPLFWAVRGDRLYVASELKGLFASGRVAAEPDWADVLTGSAFLSARRGVLRDDVTHFRDVHTVPPGAIVTVDLATGAIGSRRYHSWAIGTGPVTEPEEYVDEYRRLLRRAVDRACLSDAPVTLLLSGGIDSVAVAALAAEHRQLTAWTVLSASTQDTDYPAAVRAAAGLGLPLGTADTRTTEQALDLADWCWVLRTTETPLAGPEQYYKLATLHAARTAGDPYTVVLTGQGSDEFNGGYSAGFAHDPPGGWDGFLDALRLGRQRHALDRLPGATRALGEHLPEQWLNDDWLRTQIPDLPSDPYEYWITAMRAGLQQYNCWHEDRMAAAFSAESRPVFLDVDLVAHALSVPPELRPDLLWDKRILRQAITPLLPDPALADRPKGAFHLQAGQRIGQAAIVGLLTRHGDALIEMATAGPTGSRVLAPSALRTGLATVVADPDLTGLNSLLRLLSLGALETLLSADSPSAVPGPAVTGAGAGELIAGVQR
ncbi:asparagine synthetase B family protein [Cryptosporangium arvum]|uniref:asparagine synthetase B family protein n=1 Tax=Cryptosporangium arvum TaxID=80871 RepID=UPI0004B91F1A|nr:asparagine synthase-related protein [Cryptosporangium arvum]